MSLTQQYVRRTASCDAVRVTKENLVDIAKWCGGAVCNTAVIKHADEDPVPSWYISVRVTPSRHAVTKRRNRAEIGDWILKDVDGFKVYTDNAFRATFIRPEPKRIYDDILKIVKLAMLEQDATTYHQDGRDMNLVAKASTMLILEKVEG